MKKLCFNQKNILISYGETGTLESFFEEGDYPKSLYGVKIRVVYNAENIEEIVKEANLFNCLANDVTGDGIYFIYYFEREAEQKGFLNNLGGVAGTDGEASLCITPVILDSRDSAITENEMSAFELAALDCFYNYAICKMKFPNLPEEDLNSAAIGYATRPKAFEFRERFDLLWNFRKKLTVHYDIGVRPENFATWHTQQGDTAAIHAVKVTINYFRDEGSRVYIMLDKLETSCLGYVYGLRSFYFLFDSGDSARNAMEILWLRKSYPRDVKLVRVRELAAGNICQADDIALYNSMKWNGTKELI